MTVSDSKSSFYVTTPIYYVTAKPHIGTLYSTILADVAARWHAMYGDAVFFLTGTDEHGQKVAQAAEKAGTSPQEFVDSFIPAYKNMWKRYELDYSYFIRTTDKRHEQTVEVIIKKLMEQGDIYKGSYNGWYCTPCETFVAETTGDEKEIPVCPQCQRQTTAVQEESYFFKLSAYQDKLLAFYNKYPEWIIPKERQNEIVSFVKSGLKDLSISRMRTKVSWGIPFPGDDKHVVYVWIDALSNYISAIGYTQHGREKEFNQWWPANLHILGKDIVRFHAVYWPAFLMALNLELPQKLLVHGWIKVDDKKMSKSFGNVVDPDRLADSFGVEPIRYYLMRQIPVNQDGNFSITDVEHRIAADLADSLGNLLNRMIVLAVQNSSTELSAPTHWSDAARDLCEDGQRLIAEYVQYMNACLYHQALASLWEFIGKVNAYFHSQEPWKVAKQDSAAFKEIISATAHALRMIAYLLWPIMPQKMESLLYALGFKWLHGEDVISLILTDSWNHTFVLRKVPVLFEKPEPGAYEKILEKKEETPVPEHISMDDLGKVQLIVGTIEACEEVEKSDKLYQLIVDFGPLGTRTILSGVKMHFSQEDLIGKQGIFVFNLAPRKMMGLESQGMMLLAQDANGKLSRATVATPVPNGTRLR